jgi:hypothetical protein
MVWAHKPPLPNNDSPKLSANKIKEIQQIVGSI